VNYFGHAAIASERRRGADFVLGAMLPDFAAMLRTVCPDAASEPLRAGLSFHHDTDAVFHDCPTFGALNLTGLRELRAGGVGRGPARAAAHLGTELLLDAVLADQDAYRRCYLAALEHARDAARELSWRDTRAAEGFLWLTARLHGRGVSLHEGDPERIAQRLARALEGRPRLEPNPTELAAITRWLDQQRPRVVRAAESLLTELRHGLALREQERARDFFPTHG